MTSIDVAPATAAAEEARAGKSAGNKVSIVMYSGTADKFLAMGVLAQAAAAIDMDVNVFVAGFSLLGFTKEHHDLPFPPEFAAMAPMLAQGMEAKGIPAWDAMLRQAKELGARVHACSMTSAVLGLGPDDYNELVDDMVGAATFLQAAEGGETLFI